MAGPKLIPQGCRFWPERSASLTVDAVVDMYNDGFAGAYEEPEETEKFEQEIKASGGFVYGADAARSSGFEDSGVGALTMPFLWAQVVFPGCFPGAGQERGDCVSHCEKNANMVSYACEIVDGKPDEVHGKIEEAPKIPLDGLLTGAFSTAVFYWFRRHAGDGWSCDASARVAMREAGLVTCDNHPELGVDLTRYKGSIAGKYGRNPPTGSVADALDNNLIRQATTLKTREERRDFLANGYALSTCGSEGWSNRRDENGFSQRRGSWAHAMMISAFDDRPVVKEAYGDSLELIQNSWAVWNSGGRDILESESYLAPFVARVAEIRGISASAAQRWLVTLDIINDKTGRLMIPKGSFWAKSSDVARRRVIAKSSVNGWTKRAVTDLGFIGNV